MCKSRFSSAVIAKIVSLLKINAMKNLTNQQWQEQVENDANAVILDVRTDEEVAEGKIPGALQIDIQNPPKFMEAVQELDKSKNYYVYCKAGGRSVQACMVLNSVGIETIYNLEDGFSQWDGKVER